MWDTGTVSNILYTETGQLKLDTRHYIFQESIKKQKTANSSRYFLKYRNVQDIALFCKF